MNEEVKRKVHEIADKYWRKYCVSESDTYTVNEAILGAVEEMAEWLTDYNKIKISASNVKAIINDVVDNAIKNLRKEYKDNETIC
jgi:hypothetical protein